MLQVTLNITLTLEGPILTKSSMPGHYGIHAAMAVNQKGKYYIPGTLIKGRLRQSWKELRDATSYIKDDEIDRLLGRGSGSAENPTIPVNPHRGLLKFSDFISEKEDTHVLHRIRMDDDRGTVDKGALLIMETPFAPGEKACFHGTISYIASNDEEAKYIKDYVERGLKWITSLGSYRTIGFGRLINVAINMTKKEPETDVKPASLSHADNVRLSLVLLPQAPFCIAKRRVSHNLFESEIIIPGNIIKGAIASMWGEFLGMGTDIEITNGIDSERQELSKYFDKIRFRHAFPAKLSKLIRPVTPPLSLCKVKGGSSYYDIALCNTPVLINGMAPAFDIDWKDRSDVDKEFGWAIPQRELRVRTAIDETTRKAKENELFAYEMIIPEDIHWLTYIDLGMVPEEDRDIVKEQLYSLLAFGLNGLGKTKVSINIELKDLSSVLPIFTSNPEPINNQYVITLQTPAILCDPSKLNETSGRKELFDAYCVVWKQLSNDSLCLVRYFARQCLAGGYYLHKRFLGNKPYEPFLLTDAGSVFILKIQNGKDADARNVVKDWLRHGLPLPEWAVEKYKRNEKLGNHWSNCPYIRENGYGEVAVNLAIHIEKQPKEVQSVY